jgi:hypothetical protein
LAANDSLRDNAGLRIEKFKNFTQQAAQLGALNISSPTATWFWNKPFKFGCSTSALSAKWSQAEHQASSKNGARVQSQKDRSAVGWAIEPTFEGESRTSFTHVCGLQAHQRQSISTVEILFATL